MSGPFDTLASSGQPLGVMALGSARASGLADTAAAAGGSGRRSQADIAEAARAFEAQVIGQLLQPMFASLSTDPPFGGGHGEQMWRSMLVDEYGKVLVEHGGLGLSDAVMRVMLQAQEG